MASLLYCISEILFQSDANKIQNHPSRVVFNSPYFVLEFLLILIAIYFFPPLSQDASWYIIILLYIIWVILGTIIITLSLDLLHILRHSIISDLSHNLFHDFTENSAIYGEDYMFIEKLYAHKRHRKYSKGTHNASCAICRNDYADDDMVDDKSLLFCGHLFHKQCLRDYERHQWNNNQWGYAQGLCSHCRGLYHAHSQKFDFDENYFDTAPWYLRKYHYCGRDTIFSLYWRIIYKTYRKYKGQHISQRERFISRNMKIIKRICKFSLKWIKHFMVNHCNIFV